MFAFSVMARPPEGPAYKGMSFGVATTEKDAINASDLSSVLNSKEPKDIKVKDSVTFGRRNNL